MADSPMLVPHIIWAGDCENIFKVPFHTFGDVKRRHLRLKPEQSDIGVDVAVVTGSSSDCQIVKAAQPLALIWRDSRPSSAAVSPVKSPFLASPFSRRAKEENEILLEDIIEIAHGNNTAAFQAFIAKNGKSSIPHPQCCFSIVTPKRSVDFFVSSGKGSQMHDTEMARAMVDSLKSLLRSYNQKQIANVGLLQSSLDTIRQKDAEQQSNELFSAVAKKDLGRLRYLFDSGIPVDHMDPSGDTALLLGCRLGLYDVCKLTLHEYSAKNDPHPNVGQTALQVAVSNGHAKIVKLILDTAEPSGADRIICNHIDDKGEAPIHVAARCGQIRIMELLLTHGAEIGLVDSRGRTCLHCAAGSGHDSCLGFALDFGGDEYIEVKQDNGFTCLHSAIRANSLECVDVLLRSGADLAAETPDGKNAYELANKQRNQAIMKLLLEYDSASVSSSGSYSDDSDSSLSGSDNMFAGLNTYTVTTPAPKKLMSPMLEQSDQTPSTYYTANQTPSYFPTPSRFMSPSPGMPAYGQVGLFQHQGLMNGYRYGSPGNIYQAGMAYTQTQFVHNGDLWTIDYTDEGYQYYYNSRTNVSTWDDPRSSANGQLLKDDELEDLPQMNMSSVLADEAIEQNSKHVQDENQPIHNVSPMTAINTKSSSQSVKVGSPEVPLETRTSSNCIASQSMNNKEATSCRNVPVPATPGDSCNIIDSSGSTGDKASDPRAALVDMLKKRALSNGEPAPMIPKTDERNGPNEIAQTPDPRTALMDMLKKRNVIPPDSTNAQKQQTPPPKSGETNPDQRAALMAMLKARNSSQNESVLPAKGPEQSRGVSLTVPLEDAEKTTLTPKTKAVSKDELMSDLSLKKYVKMTSFGVPPEAVVQKMVQESVEPSKIDIYKEFHNLMPREQPRKEKQQQNIPTKEDLMKDDVLAKYVRMTKVGVPVPAVCSKMTQDNISPTKIHLFNLAYGLVKVKSPKRSPIPPLPRGRRRASTALVKIHWNTVDQSLLKNSVWASQTEGSELDESDIQKLESLFATAQINRAAAATKKAVAKKNMKKTSFIDPKRANNVAISLAQYRRFTSYDDLVQAVITLNGQHLNLEKLQNMTLLLPKKEEIKQLEQYKGKTMEGLGRAEQFFLAVMKVDRFSEKLSAFIFSLQFEESTRALYSSLHTLSEACQEVVSSKKLAMILRRFLAIGNVMNESAGKPLASGITLDSLIKTAKMKGTDGKTTILDSVISSRLELADYFRSEVSTMRDAMRLDLDDLRSNLKELESGLKAVEQAIKAERTDIDLLEDGLISEPSEKFLRQLEPFHARASGEVDKVKALFDRVEEHVQSLCSFFAEDPKTKASTIFGVLLEFSALVERSAEQLKRREAVEKRRQSLRTPVKTSRPM